MNITEYFTAWYDAEKDVIHNAIPGTLVYYHEEGHRRQWKSGEVNKLKNIAEQLLILTFAFLVFYPSTAKFPFVLWFLIYLWFEGDAWGYAIKKKKEGKPNQKS